MPSTTTILENWIPVYCRLHGEGEAIAMIDYGYSVNTVFLVRLKGGIVKHFLSDDILIFSNPMDGNGYDVEIPENWKPITPKVDGN